MPQCFSNLPCPALPQLARRELDSHKGSYGNAVLIGGMRGMAGAISLAGMAAVRAGAGLVRLAVPDCSLDTVAAFSPCYMTLPQPHDCCGRISELSEVLLATLTHASCVAIGPGLGRSTELQHLIRQILDAVPCPVVIDADGLNNVADGKIDLPRRGGLVLTPHPGEWTRLSSIPALARQEQIDTSAQFALEHRATIVLKGHSTFVTDGMTGAFVQTGTPAMATGGSGDVLTGVIAALICQGLAPRDAAHLAVHIHGLAGQIAQRDQASHVVLPTELISYLPHALRDAIENSVPRSDSK